MLLVLPPALGARTATTPFSTSIAVSMVQTVVTPFGAQRVGGSGDKVIGGSGDSWCGGLLNRGTLRVQRKIPRARSASKYVTATAPVSGATKKQRGTKRASKSKSRECSVGRTPRNGQKASKRARRNENAPSEFMQALQAVIINLDRRPDRLDGCATRLRTHCPWLCHNRFSATDGKKEDVSLLEVVTSWHTGQNCVYQRMRSVRKGWNDLDSYQERQLVLSAGERGCAHSHIRAWRHCLDCAGSANEPLLVLEDDAAPTPQFTAVLKRALAVLPPDADVLYLGYSQGADWPKEVSADLVEAGYVWTTVGYLVWPAGAKKLLANLPVDQPVDNYMAQLCADGKLQSYCVRPKIVLQAEAWNVNSDVAHSDEHYWGPSSDVVHSDQFYWGGQPSGDLTDASTMLGFVDRTSTIWSVVTSTRG